MVKLLILLAIILPLFAKANEIRVVTEHLPPYQVAENGEVLSGTSFLIMEEVLKRAKIQVTTEVMPWVRAYRLVLNEPNTIIYSITKSAERESLFKWVGQLHHLEYSFFSTKSNVDINIETNSDALNYTVVSVRGSFEANSLKRKGFIVGENLILVVDYITAWEMLKLGRAELAYGNAPVTVGSNENDSLFVRQGNVVEIFDLYVAANINTDKETIEKLSAALQSVKNDPSFSELFKINRHN
jgi:polar amino acid transport system substrate-binding protein